MIDESKILNVCPICDTTAVVVNGDVFISCKWYAAGASASRAKPKELPAGWEIITKGEWWMLYPAPPEYVREGLD